MLMRISDNPMELYRLAAARTKSLPERDYLLLKAAQLGETMG